MIVRFILMLALLFSTLPAPAAAAPACHDAPMAAMAAMAAMVTDHATPAPAPEPDQPRKMSDALCVGCIAPATLRTPRVQKPRRSIAEHGVPPLAAGLHAPVGPPETPPPRV